MFHSQTKVDSANPSQTKSSKSQEVARTYAAVDGHPNVEDVMEVRNSDVSDFIWFCLTTGLVFPAYGSSGGPPGPRRLRGT